MAKRDTGLKGISHFAQELNFPVALRQFFYRQSQRLVGSSQLVFGDLAIRDIADVALNHLFSPGFVNVADEFDFF